MFDRLPFSIEELLNNKSEFKGPFEPAENVKAHIFQEDYFELVKERITGNNLDILIEKFYDECKNISENILLQRIFDKVYEIFQNEIYEVCNLYENFIGKSSGAMLSGIKFKEVFQNYLETECYFSIDMCTDIEKKKNINLEKVFEFNPVKKDIKNDKEQFIQFRTIRNNNKWILENDNSMFFGILINYKDQNDKDTYKLSNVPYKYLMYDYYSEFYINYLCEYKRNPLYNRYKKYDEYIEEMSKYIWEESEDKCKVINGRALFERYFMYDAIDTIFKEVEKINKENNNVSNYINIIIEELAKIAQLKCVFARGYFIQLALAYIEVLLNLNTGFDDNLLISWSFENDFFVNKMNRLLTKMLKFYFAFSVEVYKRRFEIEDWFSLSEKIKSALENSKREIKFTYLNSETTISRFEKCDGLIYIIDESRNNKKDVQNYYRHKIFDEIFGRLKIDIESKNYVTLDFPDDYEHPIVTGFTKK